MSTLEQILAWWKIIILPESKIPLEVPNFGRNELAKLVHDLDFKVGVEVGVAGGEYSEILCKANPQMQIYGVDPYIPYKGYRDYARQSTLDTLEIKAHRLMRPFKNYTFLKQFSEDAAGEFADGSVDFVYLDGNHEEPFVSQDIEIWHKKLKPGGILAGHDWVKTKTLDGTPRGCDVKEATKSFTEKNNINPWFVLGLESTADPKLIRDKPRSWMWIK